MKNQFTPLADTKALDQLLKDSDNEPVVLFKHSSTCPISAAAYQEMSRLEKSVALIVVQRARDVSLEIATRTGVEHQSPQAIILRNGKAVWSASHWRITSAAVEQALHEHEAK